MQTSTHLIDLETAHPLTDLPVELDSPNTLVLFFSSLPPSSIEATLQQLVARFPQSLITGCSTAGEIIGAAVEDGSAVVSITRFEHTRLRQETVATTLETSEAAGIHLAKTLIADDLAGILLLTNGIGVNGSTLIDGIHNEIGPNVIVTGGLAGDNTNWRHTWVVSNGATAPGVATAIGFYGDRMQIGHGSLGGWDPFGPRRTITQSDGRTLLSLDGKPALELYKSYLGTLADELPASGLRFPLAIRRSPDDANFLIRTVMDVDEETQSVTFAGDVPEGWTAQLMRANIDRLVEGASGAGRATALSAATQGPVLGLAISCVGRRLVLRERIDEEVEAALHALPAETRLIGFYSYGEISPHTTGRCELHNQTMTLTTFSET